MNSLVLFSVVDIVLLIAGLAIYLWIVGGQLTRIAGNLEECSELVQKIKANAESIEGNLEHVNRTGGVIAGALPLLYGPELTRIDGQQAIEFVISDEAIVHFANGGGAKVALQYREIAIAYRSRLYSCSLTVAPDEYERYVEVFRTFCRSVRLGGAP